MSVAKTAKISGKAAAICLCAIMALSPAACNKESGVSGGPGGSFAAAVGTTYGTEKVLKTAEEFPNQGETLKVEACRGEIEGGQIIITAIGDVSEYNAEVVGALRSASGGIFPAAGIAFYAEKYIEVKTIYDTNNSPPTGLYPDALLPIEKAVEYGENSIKAGEKQGIYVAFDVPRDQDPGLYTGEIAVTLSGRKFSVPVELTVRKPVVSEETHTKSYFNLGFTLYLGEHDSTQAMWRTYAEKLISYRIMPSTVLNSVAATEECMDRYVDEVADLVVNHGLNTINSPYKTGNDLAKFLVKLAEKSMEIDRNLVGLVIVKGPDEPTVANLPSVKTNSEQFNAGIKKAKEDVAKLSGTSPLKGEIAASIDKIPNIITLGYNRSEVTDSANIDTYCPWYDKYDSAESRALYDDQAEKGRWWYGCNFPRMPFPTYHMEDTLVSARSVGWMMSEYDITGNLYWSATVYARWNGSNYQYIDDIYSDTAAHFWNANGDGYLFYPGGQYGIYGPIGSLRLEAIRDGIEDNELWYALNSAYDNAGSSADDIQRLVSNLFYSGTRVKYDGASHSFAAARKSLIDLVEMAEGKPGLMITGVNDNGKGTVTFNIRAAAGAKVYSGNSLLSGSASGDHVEYELPVSLTGERNMLSLRAEKDDEEYSFSFDLGGKMIVYTADDLLNENNRFSDGKATVVAEKEGDRIKLTVGAVSNDSQTVRYDSAVLSSLDSSSRKIRLFITADAETPFRFTVKYKGSYRRELYSGTLAMGENVVEIDLGSSGEVEYAEFGFGSGDGEHGQVTVYLGGLAVFGG